MTALIHVCEQCRRNTELMYCRATDEYLCEDCIMALAIAYYEAQRAADAECPLVPLNAIME